VLVSLAAGLEDGPFLDDFKIKDIDQKQTLRVGDLLGLKEQP
jgi:hypothetical protein